MAQDLPHEKLKSLRSELKALAALEALPEPTRRSIEQALKQLEEAADVLDTSTEQLRLAAIYRVSQALSSSLDLDQVLNQVMDAVISLTGAERGFLMLVDQDTNELRLKAARNIEQETLLSKNMEVSQNVLESVLKSGEGVVTTDAQTDPRFARHGSVMFYALRSLMCAPLIVRGMGIGVIYVDNRAQSGLFTRDDLELLNAFAVQAAIAIDNARLYTQTDQALVARITELETLTQIDRELNTSLEIEHVLEITYRRALQGTGANQGWILLASGDHPAMQVVMGSNPDKVDIPAVDELLDKTSFQALAAPNSDANRLVAPLKQADNVIGALIMESKTPFSESSLQFLTRLAARAAIAIENARLYQAVQQADLAKSRFVSVVSHELRIPMTSIRGYTDLILQGVVGEVNEQQLNFLGIIRNNVERMSKLVSDLSDISRIETGRLKLEPAMISLKEYIEETIQRLQPRLAEKAQKVEIDIAGGISQVHADSNRLVQVLTNLVSNANKYTPEHGKVRIRARQGEDHVRVEVIDNGIGISPEDQAKLFSQFFRSEDPLVREQQGWGLGLNLTKRLVELMGGTIGAQSVPGKGSNFWFTLPIREVLTT
ncbi:MAG TPA: GAF domain-containing sensor histidine kinase [Anaerolineales bacterium]|nr:GAF domain-containing sensor histidine kinase [Anaerolineales bacterium]